MWTVDRWSEDETYSVFNIYNATSRLNRKIYNVFRCQDFVHHMLKCKWVHQDLGRLDWYWRKFVPEGSRCKCCLTRAAGTAGTNAYKYRAKFFQLMKHSFLLRFPLDSWVLCWSQPRIQVPDQRYFLAHVLFQIFSHFLSAGSFAFSIPCTSVCLNDLVKIQQQIRFLFIEVLWTSHGLSTSAEVMVFSSTTNLFLLHKKSPITPPIYS